MSGDDPLNPENFDPQDLMKLLAQMLGGQGGQGLEGLAGLAGGGGKGGSGTNPLAALFGQSGNPWDAARQTAVAIATEGGAEPNVDPADRIAIDDLARVAQMHANQRPGVSVSESLTVAAVSRRTWTEDAVSAYRPFFERFTQALAEGGDGAALALGDDLSPEEAQMLEPISQMIGQMMNSFLPAMVTGSAGTMLGQLGRRVVGTYDLPIPRSTSVVQVVPAGMAEVAQSTGAPVAEVQMYVLIHELIAHSVLSIPHVAQRLEALYLDFASAFRPNPNALMDDMDGVTDLNQIMQMSSRMQNPAQMLDAMRTPSHDILMPQLDALVAAVLGFVENATMAACARLMTGHPAIRDAMRARRVDQSDEENMMERLLGLNIDGNTMERGGSFIAGIIERSGDAGLERLWASDLDLPTAAEIDAPGLWLERIGLGEDGSGSGFEIPDDLSGLD